MASDYCPPENSINGVSNFARCRAAIFESENYIDILFCNVTLAWEILNISLLLFYEWSFVLLLSVIIVTVLYVIYKSYVSPMEIFKDVSDLGFDHIKPGPHRELSIARSQATRKFGNKIPPPYPNGWFALIESRDLKIGGVFSVDALGHNFCVYRGEDGVARCVDAYCPHLGANIAIGGKVCGSCIECPFHKWRFAADGTCVSVLDMDTPPKGVSIKSWTSVETDGAVFIWHDAEGREPQWTIPPMPDQTKSWAYRGKNEFLISTHCQDIPENGSDASHLNAIHATSLFTDLGQKYPILQTIIGRHVWSGDWERCEDHTAELQLRHHYRIGNMTVFHFVVDAIQLGPGLVRLWVRTAIGPVFVVLTVTPIGPLLQKVIHRMYSPFYNAPLASAFVKGECIMFERDITVWNNKCYINSPIYVRADRAVRAYRSWYTQFYSEHSISFREALNNNVLDW